MYHLLVNYNGWAEGSGSMSQGRTFEYTSPEIESWLKPGGTLDTNQARGIPAIFASENQPDETALARVGSIHDVRLSGGTYQLDYSFDSSIPPIKNAYLTVFGGELDIEGFEFGRTHWAVKRVDLFKFLYTRRLGERPSPGLFSFDDIQRRDPQLISIMMPFDARFDDVHRDIGVMVEGKGLSYRRADDLWIHHQVMDDIVSLICRSQIVILDCTGRNPNVLYEAGIAHSLGKDTILITQTIEDVPFDLRHLRALVYLNNEQGRREMCAALSGRINNLLSPGPF